MPGTSAKIFIAQSQLLPLDPVVVSNSPAHDATNVPVNASIVLQFSKPMDTNSVQSAFSTTPAVERHVRVVAGARHHDVHVPAAPGFPALTTVIVRITNSAVDAVSGNAMFAPYQLQFHTGSGVADVTPPTVSLLTPTNGTRFPGISLISGTATDNVAVQKVEIELDNGIWVTASRDDVVEPESEQFQFSQRSASDFRARDGHQRQYFADEHRQREVFQRARQLPPAHQRRQSRKCHRLQRQPLVAGHRLQLLARSVIPAARPATSTTPSAASVPRRNRFTSASITARPAADSTTSLIVPKAFMKPRCSRRKRIGTVPANASSTSSSRASRC